MQFFRTENDQSATNETILKSVAFFSQLNDEQINLLLERTTRLNVASNDFLIHQGESAEDLYITLRGKFYVRTRNSTIAEIGPGEPIGEIAFFAGGMRTADVIAARSSEVLKISRSVYDSLAKEIPEIATGVIEVLAKRIAASNAKAPKVTNRLDRSVALIATSDGALPSPLIEKLRAEIANFEDWIAIDETDAQSATSCRTVQELTDWLSDYGHDHKNTLLICSSPETDQNWSEAVLDNCDEVFITGPILEANKGVVKLSSFEQMLFSKKGRNDVQLVLWRNKKEERTKFVRNWLKSRKLKRHHQVALDTDDDFKRLAETIQGNTIDLFD